MEHTTSYYVRADLPGIVVTSGWLGNLLAGLLHPALAADELIPCLQSLKGQELVIQATRKAKNVKAKN